MYAIIESGNKQYKISKKDVIDIELIDAKPDSEVKLDKVLLLSDGKKDIKVGTPYLKGSHVTAKVIGDVKDEKVTSFKYKNKTGYHRTIGHRQNYTRIEIKDIKAAAAA
jgi:large subunit ribosomal protein L21